MSTTLEEVDREFRYMLLRVARNLSDEECEDIAFAEGLPKDVSLPDPSKGIKNIRIYMLQQLVARGRFSPLTPDGLLDILENITRLDLKSEVEKYKQSKHFKDSKKELGKKKRSGLKTANSDKKEWEMLRTIKQSVGPVVHELKQKVLKIERIVHQMDNPQNDVASVERALTEVKLALSDSELWSSSSVDGDQSTRSGSPMGTLANFWYDL